MQNHWRLTNERYNIEKYLFQNPCIYSTIIENSSVFYSKFSSLNKPGASIDIENLLKVSNNFQVIFGSHPHLLAMTIARMVILCMDSNIIDIPFRIDSKTFCDEKKWMEQKQKLLEQSKNFSCLVIGNLTGVSLKKTKQILSETRNIASAQIKVIIVDLSPEYDYRHLYPEADFWVPLEEYIAPADYWPSLEVQKEHCKQLVKHRNFASALTVGKKMAERYSSFPEIFDNLNKYLQSIHNILNTENKTKPKEKFLFYFPWKYKAQSMENHLIATTDSECIISKIGQGIWKSIHEKVARIVNQCTEDIEKYAKRQKINLSGFCDLAISNQYYETSYAELVYFMYIYADVFELKPKKAFVYLGEIVVGQSLKECKIKKIPDLFFALKSVYHNRPNIKYVAVSSEHLDEVKDLPQEITKNFEVFLYNDLEEIIQNCFEQEPQALVREHTKENSDEKKIETMEIDNIQLCHYCGWIIKTDKFCCNCGKEQTVNVLCSECNNRNSLEARYCYHCGNEVKKGNLPRLVKKAIIIIKAFSEENETPLLLNYYSPDWGMPLFINISMKQTICGQEIIRLVGKRLGVASNNIKIKEDILCGSQIKQTNDKEKKEKYGPEARYTFYYVPLEITSPPKMMLRKNFQYKDIPYEWFSLSTLKSIPLVRDKNYDVLEFLSKNYDQSLTKVKASFKEKIQEKNPRIFICYVREDRERVGKIYQYLKSRQLNAFIDIEDIYWGENWENVILQYINNIADFFIVCLSESAIRKKSFWKIETENALKIQREISDVFVLPLKLEDISIPQELEKYHMLELFDVNNQHALGRVN